MYIYRKLLENYRYDKVGILCCIVMLSLFIVYCLLDLLSDMVNGWTMLAQVYCYAILTIGGDEYVDSKSEAK